MVSNVGNVLDRRNSLIDLSVKVAFILHSRLYIRIHNERIDFSREQQM